MRDERGGGDAATAANDPLIGAILASEMAMVVTDALVADNPIVFANDAFMQLSGYPREEVVGRNCRFMQGPDTDPADVAQLREAIVAGRAASAEILNYRHDGRAFWNGLYISPVRDSSGQVTHFFGAQLDVGEKKRAEQAVRRARDDLEAAVHARTAALSAALEQKTALLHELDHRVKNNLQLIASLLMLQIRRTTDGPAQEALRNMLGRISAISTVHRRLFQSEDLERFDVIAFLHDLATERGVEEVVVDAAARGTTVPSTQAAALSLVINELVSFAMDGGVADAVGLTVEIAAKDRLSICADGSTHPLEAGDAFGREIITMLSRQLRATSELSLADGRRRAVLTLPL